MNEEMICGNCALWKTDDGTPYCLIKDLYTHTDEDHKCDESMLNTKFYFIKRKDGE